MVTDVVQRERSNIKYYASVFRLIQIRILRKYFCREDFFGGHFKMLTRGLYRSHEVLRTIKAIPWKVLKLIILKLKPGKKKKKKP